eukprot:gene4046-7184_t
MPDMVGRDAGHDRAWCRTCSGVMLDMTGRDAGHSRALMPDMTGRDAGLRSTLLDPARSCVVVPGLARSCSVPLTHGVRDELGRRAAMEPPPICRAAWSRSAPSATSPAAVAAAAAGATTATSDS